MRLWDHTFRMCSVPRFPVTTKVRSFSDGDLEVTGRLRWRHDDSEPTELVVNDENKSLVVYRKQLIPFERATTELDERVALLNQRVTHQERLNAGMTSVTSACPSGRWTTPPDEMLQGDADVERLPPEPSCAQQ